MIIRRLSVFSGVLKLKTWVPPCLQSSAYLFSWCTWEVRRRRTKNAFLEDDDRCVGTVVFVELFKLVTKRNLLAEYDQFGLSIIRFRIRHLILLKLLHTLNFDTVTDFHVGQVYASSSSSSGFGFLKPQFGILSFGFECLSFFWDNFVCLLDFFFHIILDWFDFFLNLFRFLVHLLLNRLDLLRSFFLDLFHLFLEGLDFFRGLLFGFL